MIDDDDDRQRFVRERRRGIGGECRGKWTPSVTGGPSSADSSSSLSLPRYSSATASSCTLPIGDKGTPDWDFGVDRGHARPIGLFHRPSRGQPSRSTSTGSRPGQRSRQERRDNDDQKPSLLTVNSPVRLPLGLRLRAHVRPGIGAYLQKRDAPYGRKDHTGPGRIPGPSHYGPEDAP